MNEEPPARLVTTELAVRELAVDELRLLGEVRGVLEVQVFAQLPERIAVVHVEEGQRVAAGEPIVTLDGDLTSTDYAQARAALDAAIASRDQLESELSRTRELVAQSALPARSLEQLDSQLRTANAQVAQLQAARRAAGARQGRTVVRAPADGLVARLRATEGELAAPQVPVCTVVQMDEVEIEVRPIEADFVRLEEEMAVRVTPPALPELERGGRISSISPVLDRLTRTATVEVRVANEDHQLRPGMVAEVWIELSRRPDVLLIPSRAVLMTTETDTERRANVFVRDGGRARRVEVELGRRYGDRMEIVAAEGLGPGDEVIVEGQHLLRNQSRVRVTEVADLGAGEPEGSAG